MDDDELPPRFKPGRRRRRRRPGRPPAARLAWLHLRSRRVPAAVLALAACGAALVFAVGLGAFALRGARTRLAEDG